MILNFGAHAPTDTVRYSKNFLVPKPGKKFRSLEKFTLKRFKSGLRDAWWCVPPGASKRDPIPSQTKNQGSHRVLSKYMS